LEGIATLQEIETHWSLYDVLDANEALDEREDAQERAIKKAERGKR